MKKEYDELCPILESILFMAGDPISYREISEFFELERKEVEELIDYMKSLYIDTNRGLNIVTFNSNVQLSTKDEYYDNVTEFFALNSKKYLSNAALETLSIIAYKQPITKLEVEEIRGVKCDSIIRRLSDKELIEVSGTLDRPGRPNLYRTTDLFLKKFGINDLSQLPEIEDFNSEEEI
ncbi:MAG: SMC-Scp complex subunit ScpB [Tissierellia bacterium]|nr:SMC-Scp complex subunit ScpB [Tissierellia bacterium]